MNLGVTGEQVGVRSLQRSAPTLHFLDHRRPLLAREALLLEHLHCMAAGAIGPLPFRLPVRRGANGLLHRVTPPPWPPWLLPKKRRRPLRPGSPRKLSLPLGDGR